MIQAFKKFLQCIDQKSLKLFLTQSAFIDVNRQKASHLVFECRIRHKHSNVVGKKRQSSFKIIQPVGYYFLSHQLRINDSSLLL